MPNTIPTSLLTVENLYYLSKFRYPHINNRLETDPEIFKGMSPDCAVLHDWITEHCGDRYLETVKFPSKVSIRVDLWVLRLTGNNTKPECNSHTAALLHLLDKWLPDT